MTVRNRRQTKLMCYILTNGNRLIMPQNEQAFYMLRGNANPDILTVKG